VRHLRGTASGLSPRVGRESVRCRSYAFGVTLRRTALDRLRRLAEEGDFLLADVCRAPGPLNEESLLPSRVGCIGIDSRTRTALPTETSSQR
jgi:hypothetical protein